MMPFDLGERDIQSHVLVAVGGGLLLTPLPRLKGFEGHDGLLVGAAVNMAMLLPIPGNREYANVSEAIGLVLASNVRTVSWLIEALKHNAEGQGLAAAMRHHRDQARAQYRNNKYGGN